MRTIWRRFHLFQAVTLGSALWISVALSGQSMAQAQVATESAQAAITATVPDNGPPTTPILIAPGNNTYVTISQPSFVWEASTDVGGMDHYRLSVDGTTLYDNIPLTDTDNSQYTLTYNSGTGRYSLYPKTALGQGSHTWQIAAFDNTANATLSATWTFTIDTQAPSFVLTQIGTATVSISAQDAGTIPTTPVVLDANEPLLVANGEANSSVQLTLVIPDDPTQNFSTTIASNGTWSQQLGILPRDVVMTLNFVITDVAGNVSVLTGVEFTIPSDVIIIPSPSPSPSPAESPTASASATPSGAPAPGSSPPASPAPPSEPFIEIKIIPPREMLNEFLQEARERLETPFSILTAPALAPVIKVAEESLTALAPYSAVVVSSALPIVATAAVATQFGGSISPDLLIKILQALGLIPAGKPQGLVFDSETEEPIPFALLTITGQNEQAGTTQTVVTDDRGVYRGIRLPPDNYQLFVSQQDFHFPTKKARPPYMSYRDFYRGEVFPVSKQTQEQLFLIPMDPLNEQRRYSWRHGFRLFFTRLARWTDTLTAPLFLLSGFLAILFPSIWNWLVFALYGGLLGKKALGWFKSPLVTGVVIDQTGQPIERAMIRLGALVNNELTELTLTNTQGEFTLYGPPQRYQLAITKPGFVWYDQNATMSLYELDGSQGSQHLIVTMVPTDQLFPDGADVLPE